MAYIDQVLAAAPAHYYRLDDPDGSVTVTDEVGGSDATSPNGTAIARRPPVLPSGHGNAAQCTNHTASIGQVVKCIELWAKFDVQGRMITIYGGTGDRMGLDVYKNNSMIQVMRGGSSWLNVPAQMNTASHLVVQYEIARGQTVVYLNGIEVGAKAGDPFVTTMPADLVLGAYVYKGSYASYYSGALDEVALYPSALTAQQVADHYEAGRIGYVAIRYHVDGSVLLDGAPTQTSVRAYRRDNGEFLVEVVSDPSDGTYAIDMAYGDLVDVLAVPPPGVRPMAHGPIKPIGPAVLDPAHAHQDVATSVDKLTARNRVQSSYWRGIRGTPHRSAGQWYWEVTQTYASDDTAGMMPGLALQSADMAGGTDPATYHAGAILVQSSGTVRRDGGTDTSGSPAPAFTAAGDTVRFAWDADAGTLQVAVNSGAFVTVSTNVWADQLWPVVYLRNDGTAHEAVAAFTATQIAYQPPAGYQAIGGS